MTRYKAKQHLNVMTGCELSCSSGYVLFLEGNQLLWLSNEEILTHVCVVQTSDLPEDNFREISWQDRNKEIPCLNFLWSLHFTVLNSPVLATNILNITCPCQPGSGAGKPKPVAPLTPPSLWEGWGSQIPRNLLRMSFLNQFQWVF